MVVQRKNKWHLKIWTLDIGFGGGNGRLYRKIFFVGDGLSAFQVENNPYKDI